MAKLTTVDKVKKNRKLLKRRVEIEQVKNGFIVSVSGHLKDEWETEKYIANTRKEALAMEAKLL